MSLLFPLAVVVAAAAGLVYLFPEASERALVGILLVRRVVFGSGAVILSLFLLSTGNGILMLAGGVILLLILLYVIHDPNGEIQDTAPW